MLREYGNVPSTSVDDAGWREKALDDSELDDPSIANLGFLGSNPMSSRCGTVVV